ncbi:uncharacterized protein ASCRUDRAFT_91486 [Ascoidea rubescens DSM 1968]|uniref:Amino acid permease/ SLC12A domain-containing protein n=1 Tax=Ascoidea rubescens DSM 1968 TaxID=1344418 RepID=A0A1D2VGK3_9ASCO|nr:hypothetical protein ASCRUDRAFT_91486 [Ascoidea rubescens DSM 1968]ODV60729.1 hypothetical protein ASCRUDRAFT_91486 [Ascoidea rubescens DSM 1968]
MAEQNKQLHARVRCMHEAYINVYDCFFLSFFGAFTLGLFGGLKARHLQLIALGGCIGTGLFVGSGGALAVSGPAALLIGYAILSFVIYFVMNSLGEMTCFMCSKGASVPQYVTRYVDSSLGFAASYNYIYAYAILVPAEISAGAMVIQYWTSDVPVAVWITILWLVIVALNFFAVQYYGEVEFWFASLKVICIIGLLILGVVLFFGGGPAQNGRLGFHYWKNPGSVREHLAVGNAGRFCAILTATIRSGFAFILSPELITIAAGETQNPRRNLAKATKRFVYRIVFFYMFGALVIGVIVAYNDEGLLNAVNSKDSTAAASPFVIGIQNAGIPVLNHIINGVILTSAWSSGNSFLYAASRNLMKAANEGFAPQWMGKCNKWGVPYFSVMICSAISGLAYLNITSSSSLVFTWLSNICTVSGFIGWIVIGITYLRWRSAMFYNGLWDRCTFKTPLQPYSTYFVIVFVSLVTITNGYAIFFHFNASDFVAAYITIPIFFGLYLGHKVWHRTKWFYAVEDIDVISGLEAIEEEAANASHPAAKNVWEKIWFWVA